MGQKHYGQIRRILKNEGIDVTEKVVAGMGNVYGRSCHLFSDTRYDPSCGHRIYQRAKKQYYIRNGKVIVPGIND